MTDEVEDIDISSNSEDGFKISDSIDSIKDSSLIEKEDNRDFKEIEIEETELDGVIELSLGKALNESETYDITSEFKTDIVIIAGPSGCGKTTLITTFYHIFQKNSIDSFLFNWSKTLLGFEQRAFNARIISKKASPKPPKTQRGVSDAILHLGIFCKKREKFYNFLLSDFSGEDYKEVIGNADLAKEDFGIVKSASVFAVVFDGELLVTKQKRNGEIFSGKKLIDTFLGAGLINYNTKINLIVTKYDLIIEKSNEDPIIKNKIGNLISEIREKYQERFLSIECFNIAAMPIDTENCAIGTGLNELLKNWTAPVKNTIWSLKAQSFQAENLSEFDRFSYRDKRYE